MLQTNVKFTSSLEGPYLFLFLVKQSCIYMIIKISHYFTTVPYGVVVSLVGRQGNKSHQFHFIFHLTLLISLIHLFKIPHLS